jgi:CTP:molybdopterin cytidylyltransferase MocA
MLIVGPDAPAFTHDASANGWTLITNLYPDEGLGGSVTLAARHANGLRADALVLLLADMPLVDKKMIGALLNHQPVMDPVATRYPNDRPGVPARFPASMFSDLAQLSGDRGAAALLIDRPDLHLIDPPSGALTDVDDPDSLARAESLLSKSNSGSSTTADWLT